MQQPVILANGRKMSASVDLHLPPNDPKNVVVIFSVQMWNESGRATDRAEPVYWMLKIPKRVKTSNDLVNAMVESFGNGLITMAKRGKDK